MPAKHAATRKKLVDPDDAPELTDEWFERADLMEGDKVIRRGRPRLAHPKERVTLRIDHDVLDHFRATGAGWQSRINEVLRRYAPPQKRKRAGGATG